jgi:FlaG/FlaF family flagellin (archaellin)
VVGVMLMLVVTIIIAAVVSGYAGGLFGGNNQVAPTLSMDVTVRAASSGSIGGFSATVNGVSQPISTGDLRLVTTYQTTNRSTGSVIIGGNTTLGALTNVYTSVSNAGSTTLNPNNAPFGFGPGIIGTQTLEAPYSSAQQFGNYTLMAGTGLRALDGDGPEYVSQVLGGNWTELRVGDTVTVNVIYVPMGKLILNKDVSVMG